MGVRKNLPAYSRREVIDKLRDLEKEGHSLSSTKVDVRLRTSAIKHFGKWKEAINTLGLTQKLDNGYHTEARRKSNDRKVVWTDEIIKSELESLIYSGFTRNKIQTNNKRLYAAIARRFGNIDNCCEILGIKARPRPRNCKYTKEEIDTFILMLVVNGENYSSNYLRTRGTAIQKNLCEAACKLYGTWNNALIANSAEPNAILRSYSEEYIIEMFKRDHNDYNKYRKYERYISKFFGGVGNLRKIIGVYEEPHVYEILSIDEINKLVMHVYNDPSVERVSTEILDGVDKNIVYSIKHHFGSIIEYFNGLDIDFLSKPVPFHWTTDNLKRQLLRMIKRGDNVNYTAIANSHDGIIFASRKLFGGYEKLFEACDLNYDDFRIDTEMASYYGYQFELTVGDILEELGFDYVKYETNSPYRPDFVIGDHWIDAKLSQWTISQKDNETIKKYEPHCERLTIIFFRGDKTLDKMITGKTRLINVSHYIERLPKSRRIFYVQKLKEIEQALSDKAI